MELPKEGRSGAQCSLCGGGGKLVSKLTKKFVLLVCFKYWQVAQLFVCITGDQNFCYNVVLLSHLLKMFLLLVPCTEQDFCQKRIGKGAS